MKYDVITVGSGLVDALVYAGVKEKDGELSFPIGTKILLDTINFSIGGGGANSAICFSHLGLKTGIVGKIGRGYNAQIILRELKNNKVDFLGVQGKGHTGYSIVLATKDGNRTILSFKGENDDLKFSEINLKNLKTRWFYFTSMGGESFESQKKMAIFAGKYDIKLAYNPSSYHTKHGANYLKEILRRTYFLSLNREEARMLVKTGDLFKGLKKLGPRIVCVTDGAKEGGIYDGRSLYRYWPNRVKVVDSTGAGDVFSSSFVTGLHRLNDIKSAIKVALTNAESLIKVPGAHNGLLNWNEIIGVLKIKRFRIKREAL